MVFGKVGEVCYESCFFSVFFGVFIYVGIDVVYYLVC